LRHKLKILHFTHGFYPEYGGTSIRIDSLFRNDGNEHHLYIPEPISIKTDEFEKFDNINVFRIKFNNKIKFGFIKKIINSNKLYKSVKKEKFDIIMAHNPRLYASAGFKYAKKNKIPLIYEIHRFLLEKVNFKKNIFKWIKDKIEYFIEYRFTEKMVKYSKYIIVQTEDLKIKLLQLFKNLNKDKIKIIEAVVDLDMFEPEKISENQKKIKNEKYINKLVVSYIGYLNDSNGADMLIELIKNIKEEIKERIKLIIIGRGPLEELLSEYINQDFIEFYKNVEYAKMPFYFFLTDILLIPWKNFTRSEYNVPSKLLQSIKMGNLIFASDVMQIKKILDDHGILFKADDVNEFMEKFEYIISNYDKLKYLRKEVKKIDLTKYSTNVLREKLKLIYYSCLE